jgi:aryl-alcohol dehydrogenase-like predicted oxidoreductase
MGNHLGGTFDIGGDLTVHRLGFGAMRITGEGIWGPPADHDRAVQVVRRTKELGIDFIDTAESYGPYVSEEIIAEALAPYDGVHVATKSGLTRTGPGEWPILGRPEFLRQGCEMSLRRLKLDAIPLWQLHRIDPKVDRAEQFGVMKELQDEGKVRHLGLSEVTVDDIKEAQQHITVTTVQNRYNLGDREHEDVLAFCEEQGIGFIPWFPLAAGDLAKDGGPVDEAAKRHDATPGQVALAWLLHKSPVMLPIPGTGSVEHLEENVAAAELALSEEELREIDEASKAASGS